VRLVLGGVAPRPWARGTRPVEEDVSSGGLDEETIGTLADRALLDAAPMSKNGYKVDLAASLLRRLMTEIAMTEDRIDELASRFGLMTREPDRRRDRRGQWHRSGLARFDRRPRAASFSCSSQMVGALW